MKTESVESGGYFLQDCSCKQTGHTSQIMKQKVFPWDSNARGAALLEGKCIPWEGSSDALDPDLSSPVALSASHCLTALHMYQHTSFGLLPFAVLCLAQKANSSGTDLSYLSTKSYAY